jgi:hypothetical protein
VIADLIDKDAVQVASPSIHFQGEALRLTKQQSAGYSEMHLAAINELRQCIAAPVLAATHKT